MTDLCSFFFILSQHNSRMRSTLFGLLALVGSEAASHDICVYTGGNSWFTARFGVTLNHKNAPRLMDQWGSHPYGSDIFTFKNDRGRVDVAAKGGWSASFDGYNWGGFSFQQRVNFDADTYVRWRCYPDPGDQDYCKNGNAMLQNCANMYRGT